MIRGLIMYLWWFHKSSWKLGVCHIFPFYSFSITLLCSLFLFLLQSQINLQYLFVEYVINISELLFYVNRLTVSKTNDSSLKYRWVCWWCKDLSNSCWTICSMLLNIFCTRIVILKLLFECIEITHVSVHINKQKYY